MRRNQPFEELTPADCVSKLEVGRFIWNKSGDMIVGKIQSLNKIADEVTVKNLAETKSIIFSQYSFVLNENQLVALDSEFEWEDTNLSATPDPAYTIEEVVFEDNALNHQTGGAHYVDMAIQPVQFFEANDIPFLEACVIKRLCRHAHPTGKGKQDIEKAIHELQLLLMFRYP